MQQSRTASAEQGHGRRSPTASLFGAGPLVPGCRLGGDDGGPVAELALVLPFLAFFVFGVIDLGRAYPLKSRVTNMAREGASYAQFNSGRVNCSTGLDITKVAKAEDPGITNAVVTVQWLDAAGSTMSAPTCGDPAPAGSMVRVTVTSRMNLITPIVGKVTGNPVGISGYEQVVVQGVA